MGIAVHTVKSHVHNVLEKLSLHSRLEVAAFTHAESNARVFLLWSPQANFHLSKPGISPAQADFNDATVPGYLMIITRRAFYNEFTDDLDRRCREVFAVRRPRSTLLRIFRNAAAER